MKEMGNWWISNWFLADRQVIHMTEIRINRAIQPPFNKLSTSYQQNVDNLRISVEKTV
jgi:hypothetical protein